MSKSKYEIEIERSNNAKDSKPVGKLSGSVRQIGLNNLENGDIVTIPSGYQAFEQTIGSGTATYVIAKVNRNGQDLALRFYPSSLFKMGVSATPVAGEDDKFARGAFIHASGSTVDEVQTYADLGEAVDAIVDRPFKANLTPCHLVTYEAREKQELTSADVRKTTMPKYDFVK